jgi:cytochrome b involved in lipid metabolism
MIRIRQQSSALDLVGKKPSLVFDDDETTTIHSFLVKSAMIGVGICSAFGYLLERSSLLHSIVILLMSILALDLNVNLNLIRQTISHSCWPSRMSTSTSSLTSTSSTSTTSTSTSSTCSSPQKELLSTAQQQQQQQPLTMSNVVLQKSNSKKSTERDLLWMIHGVSYDLQEFVDRHPGGQESILLGRGRDCTALFESYHAFSQQQQHWYVLLLIHGPRPLLP